MIIEVSEFKKMIRRIKIVFTFLVISNIISLFGLFHYYNEALYFKSERANLETWYDNLAEQVNLRHPQKEKKMNFVTPDDQNVSSLVLEVTGGGGNTSDWSKYLSDMKKMYDWVVINVEYSYDSPSPVLPLFCPDSILPSIPGFTSLGWVNDFWRFPNETIRDRAGDCEDMANLLTSMIRNYNHKKYPAWSIVVKFEKDGETKTHVAVAIPVEGGNLTILDPAGIYYTRYERGKLASKGAREALQDWFSHWEDNEYGNPRVTCIFSDNVYKEFSSNEEFIEYVKSQT